MVRVSGLQTTTIQKSSDAALLDDVAASDRVIPFSIGDFTSQSLGGLSELEPNSAAVIDSAIMNAERPSNLWYKTTGQATYWYMYALMDYYVSEISVLSTLILRSTTEIFRYGLELVPKFAMRCENCGYELQTMSTKCPVCKDTHLRPPDASQKKYFVRPNGKSFLEEANDNGQSLKDVLKAYAEKQYQNNQAYTLCITGDIVDKKTGKLQRAYPLEFISVDPKFVKYLYDDTGKPGTEYAFTRDDRNTMIDVTSEKDQGKLKLATAQGKTLYPALWQVGTNYGGTGKYWLYTNEEMYQDHWFKQSLIYGVPIWFDIEDDLIAYGATEKHTLQQYLTGVIRKIIVLPNCNDEDMKDITKGLKKVLAKNDNSCPIICLPPQGPNTPEIKAQTLELGTEDNSAMMAAKDDIRHRLCAHAGVPDMFAGDTETSGGMNNESQQITMFDRYLMDKYEYVDRQCRWIMSWFPKITDWELVVTRPGKASSGHRKMMDQIEEAQKMSALGYTPHWSFGQFYYSEEPDAAGPGGAPGGAMPGQSGPDTGIMSSLGPQPQPPEDLPDPGTARREDPDINGSKQEIESSMDESQSAYNA